MVLLLTMKMVKVMIIRGFMVMVAMEFMRMGIGLIHYYCDILFFTVMTTVIDTALIPLITGCGNA